jgi:glucosamine--fructose-6-phosphate aminotransferase (isomerizing)
MLPLVQGTQLIHALEAIPEKIQRVLEQNDRIREIALKYQRAGDFLFLGRQYSFPVALEGALKLKEISYIHAEGYPAAEMKHGPIALIDADTPSVFVAPVDELYDKTRSNIEEVKARGGPIIAITTEGNTDLNGKADDILFVPETLDCLTPLLTVVPLQLLAYHIAVARGQKRHGGVIRSRASLFPCWPLSSIPARACHHPIRTRTPLECGIGEVSNRRQHDPADDALAASQYDWPFGFRP